MFVVTLLSQTQNLVGDGAISRRQNFFAKKRDKYQKKACNF